MKKFFKKFTVLLLVVIMMVNSGTFAFAAQDGTTAKPLRFDENGKLRIMHITDTHLADSNIDQSVYLIGLACDREQPDVVIITGDNVSNNDDAAVTKGYIDKLMTVFQDRNIPVAVAFGNHDSEKGAMSREELMAYYNTYSVSISCDDGVLLPGCGTYNIPVLSSNGLRIAFNLWVFDSGSYDEEGNYANVLEEQVEWYKAKSDMLKALNGGEPVYSLAFQHIIVPEIYDALQKTNIRDLYSFKRIYSDNEYYRFDPNGINYGTLHETPCCGYTNHGQFAAMVEQGDVLGIFTGHDHTNAFGVQYQGIDIVNSLSTRYNGDRFSTQYGYRMLEVDEKDTSVYETRVVHWYDMFTRDDVNALKNADDSLGYKTVKAVYTTGKIQKSLETFLRVLTRIFAGRQVSYAD